MRVSDVGNERLRVHDAQLCRENWKRHGGKRIDMNISKNVAITAMRGLVKKQIESAMRYRISVRGVRRENFLREKKQISRRLSERETVLV